MPGFDKTGPRGKGSMTGRGLGRCKNDKQNSDEQTVSENFPRRRRLRRQGKGFGFHRRRWENDEM